MMTEKILQYQTMRISAELEHVSSVLDTIKELVEKMNEDIIEITE
jgi:hypothetical protein